MGDFFRDLSAQMKGIWARLDGGQRFTIIAVVFGALVGLGGMVWFAGRPDLREVFTAQNGTQLAEAKQALNQANIPFQPDGNSLRVESQYTGMAAAALIENGVKNQDTGGSGGEISNLTADRKLRDWFLTKKKKADLRSNLEMLEGVRTADVQYTQAKTALSQRDREMSQPMCTVILELRTGHDLNKWGKAAAGLASAAVGVPLRYVTVLDQHGRTWRFDPERGVGGNEFLDLQRKMAWELSGRAQDFLDRTYPGKALVEVQVVLNESFELTEEQFAPEQPAVMESTTNTDKDERTDPAAGGSLTDFNQDPGASTGSGVTAGSQKRNNKQETKKYHVFTGTRRRGTLAPAIKKLSCALTLHTELAGQKDQIVEAIRSIIGWDVARDGKQGEDSYSFSVLQQDIEAPQVVEQPTGPGMLDQIKDLAPILGQILGVAFVLFFLKGLLKSKGRRPAAATASAGASGGGGGGSLSSAGGANLASAEPLDPLDPEVEPEEAAKRMRREIEKAIADDPPAISRMVERWISEVKV